MPRLYANENFPLPVVERLRALGHDVLTIQEAGKANQALPDADVLAFATDDNRMVLTLNRLHYIRLHRRQPGEPRTIAATNEVAPAALLPVNAERHDSLPVFNPNTGGWIKGAQLREVRAQQTTTPFPLDPASLVLRAGPAPDAEAFRAREDYLARPDVAPGGGALSDMNASL